MAHSAPEINMVTMLRQVLKANDFEAALRQLPPSHTGYRRLRDALAEYRQIAHQFLLASTAAALVRARPSLPDERQLRFYNLHTGEQLSATYWIKGQYIVEELAAINYLLRDYRTGDVTSIDKRLLNQLSALQQNIDYSGHIHVISGYRSPKTNARLQHTSSGVAKRSLHIQGRAIDLRLPGFELKQLRQAALAMHAGGVGYYPKSDFIHLDTGCARFW